MYAISDDKNLLNLAAIHQFLSTCYWAMGIPKALIERSIEESLCFGVYYNKEQVGFARVITDKATFAYLCDVYILEAHRQKGLSKKMLTTIMKHPDLQGLRRFTLVTRDAHGLYKQFGFRELSTPDRYMEIIKPNIYTEPK
ncbi:GNAT family N-acetyltransferase [uncultured Bdellovibrio sp.]|uniref:GNAT family N-acetyltransferase n=1 Tax=Bdellovibrio sp. HCB-162 TaxID=3394234 RepID=UPI0025F31A98|nr:GNAT family N-acetyltransferase [uncultured Bdellovibrio sp.]